MKNKLLKLFKNLAIFLTIAGVLFSNIPFYALTGLIDSYEKTRGIVDKIWLVSQEHNADVVDKFVSLRNVAEKLKVQEAQAAPIAQYTGGLLVYADTVTVGTPKYQVFDDTTGFGAEQSASSVGASAINWIRVAASPTNDEWIIATRDAANVIKAQVCTGIDNGVSCGTPTQITATAGTHGFRNYDVAYEQTSGDALLVYGTATADELRKIERTGGAWSLDAAITTTRTSGTVEWVELTSRPSSNEIGIAYSDTGDDVSAYRWNGTAAADEATAAITATAPISDVRKFDISFEGTSGDMLVGAVLSGAGTLAYGTLVGTTWTITTATAVDVLTSYVDMQEPGGDNDIGIYTHSVLATSNTTEGYEWDGTAVVDGTAGDDLTAPWAANYMMAAVSWMSTTYYAVAVFPNTTANDDIDWWTMNSAGTITDQAVNVRTRGAGRFIDLFDYPNLNKVLLLTSDANSDLWADTWDGAAVTSTAWTDRTSGGARETDLAIATKDVVDFAFRLSAPPVTAVVTASSTGTQTVNMNSGATAQSITAAFRFQQDTGTAVNITALTLTDTGTITFNSSLSEEVSNVSLSYKTGVASTCPTGAETVVGNGTLGVGAETVAWSALTIPATVGPTNYTCIFITLDALGVGPIYPNGGDTIDLQIAAVGDFTVGGGATKAGTFPVDPTGATTVRPIIDNYTNSTEAGLNWAASCTGCGARIGPISTSKEHTVVINGKGFGADPGSGSRDTATNKVEIVGTATTVLGDDGIAGNQNVTAWSNTSITIRTNSELATNTDTDWATNFGDSAALRVTAGSQAVATDREFFVFPQIVSLTVPGGNPANAARETESITLNGTRFGSSQGTGTVTILAVDAGAASSWTNTAVSVTVPTAIAATANTGNVIVTQGTGANGKTHTFGTTFRVLPKIDTTSPVNLKGGRGDTISIAGEHLCQSGTCPTAFSAANKVDFTGGSVTTGASTWTATSIPSVVIPSTATDGAMTITSDTSWTSNSLTYDIKFAPATPTNSSPADLATGVSQTPTLTSSAFSDGTDGDTHVATNWRMTKLAGDYSAGQIVWVRTSGSAETTIVANSANSDGGTGFTNTTLTSQLNCGTTYYWQERYKDNSGVTSQEWSLFSSEFSFTTSSCNTLTVGVNGSQLANITRGTNNNSLGGTANPSGAFTFVTSASAATITSIKVTETVAGFIANNNLNNIKLYGDTGGSVTGQYEAGLDTQIGTTQTTFAADETVTFASLSLAANTTTIYVYVVADIDADPTSGQTIEIEITASGDVAVTSASVATAGFPKAITGTTTVANPNMTVAASGTQTANVSRGSTANNLGGSFTLTMASATGSLSTIVVSEQGTVAADTNLTNVKLQSDTDGTFPGVDITGCTGLSFVAGTPQKVTCTPSGGLSLTTTTTYIYVVADMASGATAGQTIEIEVNVSGDVTGTGFTVAGTFPVQVAGTTTIQDPSLTVGTNGTQAVNLNSGDTAQNIGGSFTFVLTGATGTLNSFIIAETGTVAANTALTNITVQSDTDGTFPGVAVTGCTALSFSAGQTLTCTPTGGLSLSTTTRYVYVVVDVASSASGGETIESQITNPSTDVSVTGAANTDTAVKAIAGTTTIRPKITGYTNSTETGLNWATSCTGCGARIGPSSTSKSQTVVISGAGFGTAPALSRATCAGTVNTGCVQIVGAATTALSDANVTAWSATSITLVTNTETTGNADADFGTNFGDSAALRVTAGSQGSPTDFEFFVFPQITSLTTPSVSNAARETESITLNGTRFGSAQGTGTVTILAVDAGAASSWTNTAVSVTVPTAIANTSYTGNVVVTQGTGANGKAHTFPSTFRVLPRTTSVSPTSGLVGDTIQVNGDHFCQTGTCPVSPNRSTTADNVKFGTTQAADADFLALTGGAGVCNGAGAAWADAEICVKVPSGTPSGSQPVTVRSNDFDSDTEAFTRTSSAPSDPTNLYQFKTNTDTAEPPTTNIAVGGGMNQTNAWFRMTMSAGVNATLAAEVEVKAVGTAFVCTGTGTCAAAVTGTGVSFTVGTPVKGFVEVTALTNGTTYHWQGRVKNTGTTEWGNWVAFGGNAETATDFYPDTSAPTISSICSVSAAATSCDASSVGASTAQIRWTTNETSDSQVKYGPGSTCPPTANTTAVSQTAGVTTHAVQLTGLSSNTTYQYQVLSVDRDVNGAAVGNSATGPSGATCNTFTTSKANTKTLEYYITAETGAAITAEISRTFTVTVAESGYTLQDVFVELNGIIAPVAGPVNVNLKVVGSADPGYGTAYSVPVSSSVSTPFTILHKVDATASGLRIAPAQTGTNSLFISPPSSGINIASAKIIVTYYAPPQ